MTSAYELAELTGKKVYIDTNIFIYLLQGNEAILDRVNELRALLEQRSFAAVTSNFTFTELLPYPAKNGDMQGLQRIHSLLSHRSFRLLPVTKNVCIQAGILRGEAGMKAPDALHVATAIQSKCQVFLSNDQGIKIPAESDLELFAL